MNELDLDDLTGVKH